MNYHSLAFAVFMVKKLISSMELKASGTSKTGVFLIRLKLAEKLNTFCHQNGIRTYIMIQSLDKEMR